MALTSDTILNASQTLASARGVLAVTSLVPPLAVIALCVVAAIGTILMLPGGRPKAWRVLGGVIAAAAGLTFLALLAKIGSDAQALGQVSPYFWLFAAISVVSAIRVITHDRPVYSALYFVLTVLSSAGFFILLGAEFMAAALVIIYAGAILVTYVFVIMLASEAVQTGVADGPIGISEVDGNTRDPVQAAAIGFLLMATLIFVIFDRGQGLSLPGDLDNTLPAIAKLPVVQGNTQSLGSFLFGTQLVSLQIAGLMLTISMIGAIVIARRRILLPAGSRVEVIDELTMPMTPPTDDPHSIPVVGTDNPRAKEYPQL